MIEAIAELGKYSLKHQNNSEDGVLSTLTTIQQVRVGIKVAINTYFS